MATASRTLVLVLACMWVSWFDFGLQTTAGAFFGVMLGYYQSDRSSTAAVFGLFTAITRGLGFPCGLLIQRFGITKITFIGSVLVPLGLLLSVFATSIYQVIVYFGFISAVGVSLTYISSATVLQRVCTGPYKKWLRISIALQSGCLSLAGFTFPYLITYMDRLYALPGVFLIFGGIVLNNVCVSLIFYYQKMDNNKNAGDVKGNGNTNDSNSNETVNTDTRYDVNMRENNACTSNISTPSNDILQTETCCSGSINDSTKEATTHESKLNCTESLARVTPVRTPSFIKRIQDAVFGHVTFTFGCDAVATSIVLGTEYSFFSLFIDILESKGYSNDIALHAYIPLNVFSLTFRLLPGFTDKIDSVWYLAGFTACGAIGQMVIMFSNNYYASLFGVGLCGVTLGGVMTATTVEIATSGGRGYIGLRGGP